MRCFQSAWRRRRRVTALAWRRRLDGERPPRTSQSAVDNQQSAIDERCYSLKSWVDDAQGRRHMKTVVGAALFLTLVASAARAQVNAGEQKPEESVPFTMTQVATFNLPWRIAFLPDGRMLITEKPGAVWLVTQQGAKTPVANVPAVLHQGQGGLLGVFLS